ncbi:hypothetical protein NIT7321_00753 [Phaeobacter italicus]|uniref:Uncharacterized protein n=1 Tax=Phaeobacter italicus TaxID=481446 RepID=A0A0H5CYE8_9RHOB|nr:hypothetical protein NIT7321_00753 [Phaeobacter italicus]
MHSFQSRICSHPQVIPDDVDIQRLAHAVDRVHDVGDHLDRNLQRENTAERVARIINRRGDKCGRCSGTWGIGSHIGKVDITRLHFDCSRECLSQARIGICSVDEVGGIISLFGDRVDDVAFWADQKDIVISLVGHHRSQTSVKTLVVHVIGRSADATVEQMFLPGGIGIRINIGGAQYLGRIALNAIPCHGEPLQRGCRRGVARQGSGVGIHPLDQRHQRAASVVGHRVKLGFHTVHGRPLKRKGADRDQNCGDGQNKPDNQ